MERRKTHGRFRGRGTPEASDHSTSWNSGDLRVLHVRSGVGSSSSTVWLPSISKAMVRLSRSTAGKDESRGLLSQTVGKRVLHLADSKTKGGRDLWSIGDVCGWSTASGERWVGEEVGQRDPEEVGGLGAGEGGREDTNQVPWNGARSRWRRSMACQTRSLHQRSTPSQLGTGTYEVAKKKDTDYKRRWWRGWDERRTRKNPGWGQRSTASCRRAYLACNEVPARHHVCNFVDVNFDYPKTRQSDEDGVPGVVLLGWNLDGGADLHWNFWWLDGLHRRILWRGGCTWLCDCKMGGGSFDLEKFPPRNDDDIHSWSGVGGSDGRSHYYGSLKSDGWGGDWRTGEMLAVHWFVISSHHHHWRYSFLENEASPKKSEVPEVEGTERRRPDETSARNRNGCWHGNQTPLGSEASGTQATIGNDHPGAGRDEKTSVEDWKSSEWGDRRKEAKASSDDGLDHKRQSAVGRRREERRKVGVGTAWWSHILSW